MTDIQFTIRKFFPAMSIHETMLHILYAKMENGIVKPDRNMKLDYGPIIDDLIKIGLVTRQEKESLKFTEKGLKKINNLREIRGLSSAEHSAQ